jgi:hypothetical protein
VSRFPGGLVLSRGHPPETRKGLAEQASFPDLAGSP